MYVWIKNILNKFNFASEDGFNVLIAFHRLSGILYVGYDSKLTKTKIFSLIIYGLFIWSVVFIANTPCLMECFINKEQIGGNFSFYIFNFLITFLNIINIFTAIVYSTRGHKFKKLIKKLQSFVTDKKLCKQLRFLVYLNITLLSILFMAKFFIHKV